MVRDVKNLNFYVRQRDARLKILRNIGPFITGSIVKIAHTCGNVNCKCASGEKHENYYLTYKIHKKTKTRYIPVFLEKDVKQWSSEYKRLKDLLREITELQLKIIKQSGKERKARKQVEKRRY